MVGNIPRLRRICELAPSAVRTRFAVMVVVVAAASLFSLQDWSCRRIVNLIGNDDEDE